MRVPDEVDGFTRVRGTGAPWPVYRDGTGPPVVLVHELSGLTPEVVACARTVVDAGFSVWLPVLAGPVPSRSANDRRRAALGVCVSRDIHLLRTGATSPVVTPLRELVSYAAEASGTGVAGVIGMCFSGGFALALAAEAPVRAAVAAQPSLPFATPLTPWCARDLGISREDEEWLAARLRSGETDVYVTRFSDDRTSPATRAREIEERLGLPVDELPSGPGNAYGFTGRDHSVLSFAPARHTDGPAAVRLAETMDRVLRFLRARLDAGRTLGA